MIDRYSFCLPLHYLSKQNCTDQFSGLCNHLTNSNNFLVIELTTCGARGKEGPRNDDCVEAYSQKELQQSIKVIEDSPFKGVQMWKVPSEDYYT